MDIDFARKIKLPGIAEKNLKYYKTPNFVNITKSAIDFSDGVIVGSEQINSSVLSYLKKSEKPMLDFQSMDTYIDAYSGFYDKLMETE